MKEQDKTSEKELNKTEISNLPDKEFKMTNIKMIAERKRIDEDSENSKKELENIKKKKEAIRVEEYNN